MALGRRSLTVGMICASLAGACATKMNTGSHRGTPDAGALDAAPPPPEAAAPRLPEAAAVMPVSPLRDAAARDSGPMCPRATAVRARDAAATTPVDASNPGGDGGEGGDADAPPEDCLAPCVWEIVRHCPPPAACTVQDYGTFHADGVPPEVTHSLRLACGDNDWWDSGGDWYHDDHTHSIYVDGQHCYGLSIAHPGTNTTALIRWGNSTENGALMYGNGGSDLDGQAFCGISGNSVIAPCVSDQDCQSKGIPVYNVQGTAAKCAPWRRIIDAAYGQFGCEKGCCPTDTPVVPEL